MIIVQHGEILNYFLPNPCRKSRTSDSIRVLVLVAAHVASYNIQVRRLMPRQVLALPEPVEGRKVGVRKLSDAVQLPLAFYLVALRIQPCKKIKTDGADPCVLVLDQRADHGRSCPDPGSEKRRGIRLGRPGLESLRRAGGCQYTGREGSVAEMQEGLAEEMMPGTKTTACFFLKPRSFASLPTSKLDGRLLSHSRPGATSSVRLRLPSEGMSESKDWRSHEVNESRSKFCSDESGSPDEAKYQLSWRRSREMSILSSFAWETKRLCGGLPGEQAEEASEDEVRSALLAPTLLRLKGSVVESREEALAQVELVEGRLRSIERDAAGFFVEGDAATS